MKINAKAPIKDLKGQEVLNGKEAFTVGDALGNILTADKTGGKLKLYSLATKFATKDSVEVDSADLALIKSAVDSTEFYNALVTGQLLEMLEGLKEDSK